MTTVRTNVADLLPHAGRMRLVDDVETWDADGLLARLSDTTQPAAHPLAVIGEDGRLQLPWTAALELAAQAMALHAGLAAQASGDRDGPTPGFIAAARGLRSQVERLDTATAPLRVQVRRQMGDRSQAVYAFELQDATSRPLVEGRITVVLNRPLVAPAPVS